MSKMWDSFFARRNFYYKCKSAMKMINMRMEIIIKKRNAMQKFLKNDVADLLRSNLDLNAYERAQGLYMELNLSWCYNYVHECCTLITDKLKDMQNETECPEDCRVAVASLCYAAARFADLPELRDLRSLFSEKYGNTLDPYVNKEFVEKLKSSPPSREQKLQLMKEIAEEYSIRWNPDSFEHNRESRNGYKSENGNTRNVVHGPYVKMKDENEGRREDSEKSDGEDVMDRLLRHYSMKTWGKTRSDRMESSMSSSNGTYGRSVSMYANHTHPKLPNCDELASRIQALRKM